MPTLSPLTVLDRTLSQLMKKRQEHVAGLAEIDGIFSKFGISVGTPSNGIVAKRGPGRPPKSASAPAPIKRGRRRRGSFSQTAEELVLSLVPASTSEINKAWKNAGRGGTADNALTALVKKKLLKRAPNKEGRGSTYTRA